MQNVLYAILVLGCMGLVFGLMLAIASKVFAVKTDERLEPLIEALPGANCGGCGFSGCAAYAQAVLDGKTRIGKMHKTRDLSHNKAKKHKYHKKQKNSYKFIKFKFI